MELHTGKPGPGLQWDPTKTGKPECRVNVGCGWTASAWNS